MRVVDGRGLRIPLGIRKYLLDVGSTPISEPGKLTKLPVGWSEIWSVAGAFATISAARSPARLIMTPWPGKMPPLGAESAVVKPVLRQDSRRLSSGLISSAALRQGVVPGRSCGPREIVWACGMLPGTAGGPPTAPGPPGAPGAAVRPRSVRASINPG